MIVEVLQTDRRHGNIHGSTGQGTSAIKRLLGRSIKHSERP
jgi:hypothetical protein